MIKNVRPSSCKVPVTLSCSTVMKLETSRQIFEGKKNTQISNYMKIRPVGAELFHAGGRTDMTKLTVAFRNFANAPKNHTTDELHRLFYHPQNFRHRKVHTAP